MINGLIAVYLILLLIAGIGTLSWLFRINFFDELLVKENAAFAVSISGFVLAILFGLTGLFFGPISSNWTVALTYCGIEGILALVLLILTVRITDRLLLPRFPIVEEITTDRNLGVACVVAGVCLSSGLVINGSLCGYSSSVLTAVRDIVMYWALAQAAIWLTLRVMIAIRPFDFLHQLGEDDNFASGISLGAFVICLGVLARSAVIHSGQSDVWVDLGGSLMRWLLGLAMLMSIVAVLKQLLRSRGTSITELELANSPAPLLLLGVFQISFAIVIGLLLQRPG